MLSIDLNCDMGEGFGVYDCGIDEQVMPLITSANVACGFHASNPARMWQTVRLAVQCGVAVGAHPSYPDLVGFGRREINVSAEEARADEWDAVLRKTMESIECDVLLTTDAKQGVNWRDLK